MKFEITRTSNHCCGGQPCELSYSETGKNMYGDDKTKWFINIKTLEELCALSKEHGELVFKFNNKKSAEIEIYDSYRE